MVTQLYCLSLKGFSTFTVEYEEVTLSRLNKLISVVQGFPFDSTKTTAIARLEAIRLLQLNSPYPSIYRSIYSQRNITSFWRALGRENNFSDGSLHYCEVAHPSSTSDGLILMLSRLHLYSSRFRSCHISISLLLSILTRPGFFFFWFDLL